MRPLDHYDLIKYTYIVAFENSSLPLCSPPVIGPSPFSPTLVYYQPMISRIHANLTGSPAMICTMHTSHFAIAYLMCRETHRMVGIAKVSIGATRVDRGKEKVQEEATPVEAN